MSPDPNDKPLKLQPLGGPTAPDMDALREEGKKRHEAELRAAEKLVGEARRGSWSPATPPAPEPPPARPAPGESMVIFDWRGETAEFLESDRSVSLFCAYWGGPTGNVSHDRGMWTYTDGRFERLTSVEREAVLSRVVDVAKRVHHITLVAKD
jgi:hypothetical protein